MKNALLSSLLLSTLAYSNASFSEEYDITKDFNYASPYNNVWTFGWQPKDFSSFTLYPNQVDTGQIHHWFDDAIDRGYTPNVGFNYSNVVKYGIAPQSLSLHPGPKGEVAVARFTSPAGADYAIDGAFLAGDSGSMTVAIRVNGSSVWSKANAGAFSFDDLALQQGDTVDFVVYGGWSYGSTGLEVKINENNAIYVDHESISDLNENGADELLLLRKRNSGTVQVVVKDSITHDTLSKVEFASKDYQPISVSPVKPSLDSTVPNISVLLKSNTSNQHILEVRELYSGTLVSQKTL
ncbi:hypothetical protein [Pseudoalteromonas obscura]|uniref:Uncharacterized protein n=1 Tax=Pseudoalteromonas obscura TaxID=3048491 RepID=A0ABT7EF40_9GAMM|nr:hypothetical protein [Pseudoalteromonas sp. P94(2023)]MDK2593658.1 hypothetical protein [Pseudoalteromonas sp. P94(2023)]